MVEATSSSANLLQRDLKLLTFCQASRIDAKELKCISNKIRAASFTSSSDKFRPLSSLYCVDLYDCSRNKGGECESRAN